MKLEVVFGSRSGKGVIWALSRIASFSDTSKPRICFNLIVCLYVMFNIHHVMFSDDQGTDNMINRPENPAEMRLYLVTKYVETPFIFDRCAMCHAIRLSYLFKNNVERLKNGKKRDHPRQNRTLRS